jgi:hypothetical protein
VVLQVAPDVLHAWCLMHQCSIFLAFGLTVVCPGHVAPLDPRIIEPGASGSYCSRRPCVSKLPVPPHPPGHPSLPARQPIARMIWSRVRISDWIMLNELGGKVGDNSVTRHMTPARRFGLRIVDRINSSYHLIIAGATTGFPDHAAGSSGTGVEIKGRGWPYHNTTKRRDVIFEYY